MLRAASLPSQSGSADIPTRSTSRQGAGGRFQEWRSSLLPRSRSAPYPVSRKNVSPNTDKPSPATQATLFPPGTWCWVPAPSGEFAGIPFAARVCSFPSATRVRVRWGTGEPQSCVAPRLLERISPIDLHLLHSRSAWDCSRAALARLAEGLSQLQPGEVLPSPPACPTPQPPLAPPCPPPVCPALPANIPQCPPIPITLTSSTLEHFVPPVTTSGWKEAAQWAMQNMDPEVILRAPVHTCEHIPLSEEQMYFTCVSACLQAMGQYPQDSPEHGLFLLLFLSIPKLVLRCGSRDTWSQVGGKVKANAEHFLKGNWKVLYSRLAQAGTVSGKSPPACDPPPPDAPVTSATMDRAVRFGQLGNLGKCVETLTPQHPITCPPSEVADTLRSKHPYAPPPSLPHVELPLTDPQVDVPELDKIRARARSAPAKGGDNQWGWRTREHISPLLEHPPLHEPLA
mmetsp:Transcript_60422/g.124276  ORF Transcript_60422/g.124276 Transcript_60422/m.124276 type:complete len:456 (-) Transcript_60422:318-1685(-)